MWSAYDLAPPVTVEPLAGGINNTTHLVRTGAGDFVWREHRARRPQATILYEHHLLTWLAQQPLSFGVPVPLAARDGSTLIEGDDGALHALFTRLPGQRPDPANPVHLQAVGRGLGELHTALARYPLDPRPGVGRYGDLYQIHPRVPDPDTLTPADLGLPDTPAYADDLAWWRGEMAALRAWLAAHYDGLPHQVIHGDFDGSNTLVEGDRLTGILDFEFSSPDARAMDVASGLMFSMRPWENADPWPAATAFSRGYRQWTMLTPAEAAALPWLTRLRNVVSTVWWLGRELEDGAVARSFGRVAWIREVAAWLTAHSVRPQTVLTE
jgi:homoserine kinase type II